MKVWPKLYHLFSHLPLTVVIPIEWRYSCLSKTCSSTWPHSLIFKEARGNGDDAGVKWLFSELSLQYERAGNRIIVTPDLLSVIWPSSLSSLPFTACILGCTPPHRFGLLEASPFSGESSALASLPIPSAQVFLSHLGHSLHHAFCSIHKSLHLVQKPKSPFSILLCRDK